MNYSGMPAGIWITLNQRVYVMTICLKWHIDNDLNISYNTDRHSFCIKERL